MLSGLAKLYEYSGDSSYLDTADSIVKAVLDHMTVPLVRNISSSAVPMGDEMVLVEIGCGQASCNDQQRMFVGSQAISTTNRLSGMAQDRLWVLSGGGVYEAPGIPTPHGSWGCV